MSSVLRTVRYYRHGQQGLSVARCRCSKWQEGRVGTVSVLGPSLESSGYMSSCSGPGVGLGESGRVSGTKGSAIRNGQPELESPPGGSEGPPGVYGQSCPLSMSLRAQVPCVSINLEKLTSLSPALQAPSTSQGVASPCPGRLA